MAKQCLLKVTEGIKIEGHRGTWYSIEMSMAGGQLVWLMESEQYGDEVACIIVDKFANVLMEDVWNGFDDYDMHLA